MCPDTLAALVNDLGIPMIAGRASAIRQHVLEMPAPVVADALPVGDRRAVDPVPDDRGRTRGRKGGGCAPRESYDDGTTTASGPPTPEPVRAHGDRLGPGRVTTSAGCQMVGQTAPDRTRGARRAADVDRTST
jgi:hypothetical protein